ncbi:MAG: FAD synthase [Candidatus Methanofastidiosum methylothiophilum]|uniref:FAD synthase n=1 Tax=Candidatus Methanofastidiosum methylothiophilum TaxID=1705564 RepID=A0A150JLQ6_9EURY|nr:MAG: FAD synthase [Candidatus Methanofastidiosum methylthiophilus]MBP6932200.1 adenylyltransferase/cytidyltransferase family protein [Methanofastidiosum sp.]OQC52580.1 MAG: FAD synthase [Euryarchaeota archaeon ADurb.Bin023]KYC57370.1 MAG: FAD synthase [Candidatus Methanofastidiosum methylthiophilus]KYC58156.1 MAG: FAD synthase [Candidatus Methanofastidiosum methylthiophilus]
MKVLIAGNFDVIHPGHIYFLTEASKLGEVTVVVARDETIKKFKGRAPIFNENERKLILENLKMIKKVILGDQKDFFTPVLLEKPDIIFLGPDQYSSWIEERINKSGLGTKIMRLNNRLPYSSSELKRRFLKVYPIDSTKET